MGKHIAPHQGPVEIYSPSGRAIGWTDDPWTAAQFQQAGYIAL